MIIVGTLHTGEVHDEIILSAMSLVDSFDISEFVWATHHLKLPWPRHIKQKVEMAMMTMGLFARKLVIICVIVISQADTSAATHPVNRQFLMKTSTWITSRVS